MWKKFMKLVDLGETNIISLPMYIWDALHVNANRMKLFLTSTENCSNHDFLPELLNKSHGGRKFTQKLSRGDPIWKDMIL